MRSYRIMAVLSLSMAVASITGCSTTPSPPQEVGDVLEALYKVPIPVMVIQVAPGLVQDINLGLRAGGDVVWGRGKLRHVPVDPQRPADTRVEVQTGHR